MGPEKLLQQASSSISWLVNYLGDFRGKFLPKDAMTGIITGSPLTTLPLAIQKLAKSYKAFLPDLSRVWESTTGAIHF